jgi:cell division protein ZapA
MPQVNVLMNGRTYTVACDDGEEDHVKELGQFLDKRVSALSSSVGQVGDARLLLMAGLTIADELTESLSRIQDREKEIAALRNGMPVDEMLATETRVAEVLESAASRIETIAAKVARA